MKKNLFQSMFVCLALLFVLDSFSMGKFQKNASKKATYQDKDTEMTRIIGSVIKTSFICITAGKVVCHIANKYHEKPDIWGPVLLLGGVGSCFVAALGCGAWLVNNLAKSSKQASWYINENNSTPEDLSHKES